MQTRSMSQKDKEEEMIVNRYIDFFKREIDDDELFEEVFIKGLFKAKKL